MEWLRQLFARGLVENTVKIFFIVCILITMQNSKRKRKRKRKRNRNLSELHDYIDRSRGDLLKAFLQLPADYSQLATV